MATKENLTPLKTLVFSMGIVLIAGAVLLMVLIGRKMAEPRQADCPGGQVDLQGRGIMVDSAVEGQTMRVTLQKNEGHTEIVLIDICTGAVSGALTLKTDKASAEE
ncbi:MAG: hypothetical protein KGJ06_07110 [Pseudomonadota bacterium]|nr:hypothetical protein [Pseudomonadota bacterium]